MGIRDMKMEYDVEFEGRDKGCGRFLLHAPVSEANGVRKALLEDVRAFSTDAAWICMTEVWDEGEEPARHRTTLVRHKYESVRGVYESALDIAHNLNTLTFRVEGDAEIVNLAATCKSDSKTEGVLRGSDFRSTTQDSQVEVVNGEAIEVAHLLPVSPPFKSAVLEVRIFISRAHTQDESSRQGGYFHIGTHSSPIIRCGLIAVDANTSRLEIETDGSVTPKEAVDAAIKIVNETR